MKLSWLSICRSSSKQNMRRSACLKVVRVVKGTFTLWEWRRKRGWRRFWWRGKLTSLLLRSTLSTCRLLKFNCHPTQSQCNKMSRLLCKNPLQKQQSSYPHLTQNHNPPHQSKPANPTSHQAAKTHPPHPPPASPRNKTAWTSPSATTAKTQIHLLLSSLSSTTRTSHRSNNFNHPPKTKTFFLKLIITVLSFPRLSSRLTLRSVLSWGRKFRRRKGRFSGWKRLLLRCSLSSNCTRIQGCQRIMKATGKSIISQAGSHHQNQTHSL